MSAGTMVADEVVVSDLEEWICQHPDTDWRAPDAGWPAPAPEGDAGCHRRLSLVVEVPGPDQGWAPWRMPLPHVPGITSGVRQAQVLVERAAAQGALALMSAEQKLRVVEAAEVIKAHADAVAAEATASMFADIRELVTGGQVNEADLPVSTRDRLVAEARSLTVDEIEAATGLGSGQCWRQVKFALAPRSRAGFAKDALRTGQCSWERAQAVVERTAELPADVAEQIAHDVLEARPDGAPWSRPQFTGRLYRLVKKHQDVAAAQDAYERAVADRGAWAQLHEDGTGSLTFTGPTEVVAAAIARVDLLARRFKQAGDPRTLSQLRADVASDLIMRGVIQAPADPADAADAADAADSADTDAAGTGIVVAEAGAGIADAAADADADADTGARSGESLARQVAARWAGYQRVGQPPAARVDLVVALSTLLGLDDGVGVIPGQGPIPAWQARQIALAQGSVWARIVTDPLTGRAVERSINRYHPDDAMREQTEVRDGVCRWPGCTVPATRCQKDHEVEYRADGNGAPIGGPTSEPNLVNKDAKHHNRKTKGYWTSTIQAGTARVVWTSLLGRTYATDPMDYHEHTGTDHTGTDHTGTDHTGTDHTGTDHTGASPRATADARFDTAAWDRAERRAQGTAFAYENGESIDLGRRDARRRRDQAQRSQHGCGRCHDLGHTCPYHHHLTPTGQPVTDDTTPPIDTRAPHPGARPKNTDPGARWPHLDEPPPF